MGAPLKAALDVCGRALGALVGALKSSHLNTLVGALVGTFVGALVGTFVGALAGAPRYVSGRASGFVIVGQMHFFSPRWRKCVVWQFCRFILPGIVSDPAGDIENSRDVALRVPSAKVLQGWTRFLRK